MLKTIVFSLVLAVLFIETAKNKSHAASYYYFFEYSPCGIMLSNWITEQEKYIIVQLHNELRQKVARGEEQRGNPGPQPPALAMPNLVWDEGLAEKAQQSANRCEMKHDACFYNPPYCDYGQNIATIWTKAPMDILRIEDRILGWYDEVELVNNNLVRSYYGESSSGWGHYTQMVWAKSTRIGCGISRYYKYNFNYMMIFCNYGPAGNIPAQPVY
ncbi:venom allergen 3-like [Trichogramma pretiosum]|uniref:venom allergen 3-like n=1 Tax=Trichogramma pretiosum TaxID=7493 RepID=UPI000C71A111|nr:venom allergen 3-like [Trichogramma pretiosum]